MKGELEIYAEHLCWQFANFHTRLPLYIMQNTSETGVLRSKRAKAKVKGRLHSKRKDKMGKVGPECLI